MKFLPMFLNISLSQEKRKRHHDFQKQKFQDYKQRENNEEQIQGVKRVKVL